MNYRELSNKIKTSHPEYKDLDDLDLANKFIERNPHYKDVVVFDNVPQKPIQNNVSPVAGKPVVNQQPSMYQAPKQNIFGKVKSAYNTALADYATREIKKRELWEQNHPVLSSLQKEFDVTYGARHNNRQFLLDKLNGLNPNASEVALKNIKQSVRPAVNLATDIAVGTVAPQLVGAKYIAKASQAANIINKAKSAKRVADATKAMNRANFIKDASQVGTIGGVTGATHGLTQEVDEVMNNGKNISSDLITKPLLYGSTGAIAGPTFGGANLAKQEAMRKLAPVIANNPVVKGVADALVGVGSATGDAAVLGALEYPFGVNQEQKDAGYTMLDHMGHYVKSPIPWFGLANGFSVPIEAGVNKIRNTANKVKAGDRPELQKALEKLNKSSKDSLNMEQVEEIQNAQKLSKEESDELSTQFYTGKKSKDIKEAQQKAQEEAYEQHLQEDYNVRPKTERNASLEPTPEEFMNDAPTVVIQKKTIPAVKAKTASGKILDLPELTFEPRKPEYIPRGKETKFRRKEAQLADRPEEPISSENVSTGINTPKKDLTHVNEPSGNVREKIIKLPAEKTTTTKKVQKLDKNGRPVYEVEKVYAPEEEVSLNVYKNAPDRTYQVSTSKNINVNSRNVNVEYESTNAISGDKKRPVYKPKTDKNGNLVYDKNGDIIYEPVKVTKKVQTHTVNKKPVYETIQQESYKPAEGGQGIYKQTADDTDIYANVDKSNEYDRTRLLTKGQSNKLKKLDEEYRVVEDENGNLVFVNKKTNEPISEEKLKGLRKYFQDVKDGKITEEYIADRNEIEGDFSGADINETGLKYDDNLTISENEPISGKKYAVDDKDFIDFWEDYKGTLDEDGKPTASSKRAMAAKLWEIKDKQTIDRFKENVRKQQEYEKRLARAKAPGEENKPYDDLAAEQDMVKEDLDRPELESEVNTGIAPWEKKEILRSFTSIANDVFGATSGKRFKREGSLETFLKSHLSTYAKSNSKKAQARYDELYEKIQNYTTSKEYGEYIAKNAQYPRVREHMFKMLNDAAEGIDGIKIKDYETVSQERLRIHNELKETNDLYDEKHHPDSLIDAGKLISKYNLSSYDKEVRRHYEQSSVYANTKLRHHISKGEEALSKVRRNEYGNIIKDDNYKEAMEHFKKAEEILDKYENVIKKDVELSYAKEMWGFKEVPKDTKPTALQDGKYTKIITDTQGRTFEYGPTGETHHSSFDYAGQGIDEANKLAKSYRNRINSGLNGKVYSEPKEVKQQFDNKINMTHEEKRQMVVDFLTGKKAKNDIHYGTSGIDKGPEHTPATVPSGKEEYVVSELPAGIKMTYKELGDAGVEVFKKLAEVRPNGKIITANLGGANARGRVRVEDGTIWSDGKRRSTFDHEIAHINRYDVDIEEAGDTAKAVYEADSKLTAERATFYKNNKESIDKVFNELKNIGKFFTDRGTISALKKLKDSNGKRLISEKDIRVAKEFTDLTNAYVNCYSEQVIRKGKIYGQKGFNEAFKQLGKSNPELYRRLYGGEGDNIRVSGRGTRESIPIVLDEAETSTFTPQDKEALKKAKFSDKQIKKLQKISEQNEKEAIELGVLTQGGAAYRKEQLGHNVKWYAPQKHNPLKGEKVQQEADYWNDSKVGLFGKAEKDLKEKVTYADNIQNTYTRQTKIKALKEVDKVIRGLSKPIGKKGVDKGYVAVNRSMLNSLIYNNNSYDFFKLLTDPDNLQYKKTIKDVLSKDMSEAQAEWFADFAQKNRKPDYQIPEAVLKQALSFSKELASEQFHRYFEFPRSVGKQGSLKFLATASNAVLDTFLDNFKRTVLATPSFVVNNRLGNVSLIIANSKNHMDTLKGFVDALKMKDTDIPVGLLDNSLNEAIQESFLKKSYTGWKEFDDFANLFNGHNIKSNEVDELGKQATKFLANLGIALPNRWYNKYAKGIINVNTKFENFERKWVSSIQYRNIRKDMLKKTGQSMVTTQEFIKHVKKHPELQSTVLEAVQNILGNYNDFTPAERNVIKKIVPFYSWWRTITNSTLQLAKDNPARLATVIWYMNNIKERDKDLKEFQRGSVQTGLKDSRSGKNLLINKEAYAMPWETLVSLSKEDPVKGLSSAVNPLLRVGAETVTGKKFFGSGEITSKRYVQKTSKKTGEKYYWDTKEKKRVDSLPVSTRAGYAAKELGKNFTPYLSNNFIKGESLIQGALNIKKNNGRFLEPDKMYDADLGGWNKGDFVNNYKRFAANDSSQLTKTLSRTGIGLQVQYPLNKQEKKELKRKQQKHKEKRKKEK